jgi:hypothetical protein
MKTISRSARGKVVNLLVAIGIAASILFAPGAAAPVSAFVGFTGTYTQNFNTLSSVGGGTSVAWTNNSTLTGWYLGTDLTWPITTYLSSNGTSVVGAFRSYGIAGNTDRGLGSLADDTYGTAGTGRGYIGLVLQNNTGSTITSITVAYTGEQWRAANTTAQSFTFSYALNASVPSDWMRTAGGLSFTNVTALDFTSPINTTAGALDGNVAANRTAKSATISGLSVPVNGYFFLRWIDLNNTGNDHGLAIDDLSITVPDLAPTVVSTVPTSGATGVLLNSNVSVTFSEPVTVTAGFLGISCAASGSHPGSYSTTDSITYTFDPTTNFGDLELCTVTIDSTKVTDQDGTPTPMASNYVWSFTTVDVLPTLTVTKTADPLTVAELHCQRPQHQS